MIAVSSIVIFELRFGVAKSQRRRLNSDILDEFLSGPVGTLAFDEVDAAHAGDLRAALAAVGTPIGPYDVLIAGQALRHRATLVTANMREFERVPGLRVENWAEE
jgi:tRNA(fMet)-specific endonuclease VapC